MYEIKNLWDKPKDRMETTKGRISELENYPI